MVYLQHTGEGAAILDGSPGKEKNTMAVPKANQRAVNKYKKNNYDRIEITVPKGQRAVFQAHAATLGESVNGFIGRAILEAMERDGGTASSSPPQAAETAQGAGVVSLHSKAAGTAQEAAETGIKPAPVDKVKAAEELFRILGDLGTVDLDKARCERLGIMYLPPDTLEAAQRAAKRTGETVAAFVARAVADQEKRDDRSFQMGINPA